MSRPVISVVVEGNADASVVERVLKVVEMDLGPVHGLRGKGWIDEHVAGYNHAARHAPWLVLRDLDRDAPCAPQLARQLLAAPAATLCLRIAVRAVEAWLLADRERMSHFLRVAPSLLSKEPETLPDPKLFLVNLAKRSRHRAIREDMAPRPGTTAKVGPGYTGRIVEFASSIWKPEIAARNCESLEKCITALKKLADAQKPSA